MTLLAGAIAWLLATAAATAGVPAFVALPVAAATALLMPARGRGFRVAHLCAALTTCAVAAIHLTPGPPAQPPITVAAHAGETVRLLVRARDDGDRYPNSVEVAVETVASDTGAGWQPDTGVIALTLPAGSDVRQGDEYVVFGALQAINTGPDSDGYGDVMRRRGFAATMSFPRLSLNARGKSSLPLRLWQSSRVRIQSGLAAALAPREALLASALLFGDSHALPRDLRSDLNRTGTSHLAVVSAFNLVLLYGVLVGLLSPFVGRRRAILLALSAALVYGVCAGNRQPVVRGEILLALMSLAALSGRPHSTLWLLVIAAAGMTVANQSALVDVSFQLTFAAAAGISVIAPSLRRFAHEFLQRVGSSPPVEVDMRRSRRAAAAVDVSPVLLALVDGACISVAVTVATLPFSAAVFHEVSLYAPIANAVVIPLTPLITGLALATGVVASAGHGAGALVAAPLWLLLAGIEQLLHLLAGLPGAAIPVHLPAVPFALAWYGLIGAYGVLYRHTRLMLRLPRGARMPGRAGRRPRRYAYLAVGGGVALLAVLPTLRTNLHALRAPVPSLRLLDVPGQLALLARGKNGARVLVLTGGSAQSVSIALFDTEGSSAPVDALLFLNATTNDEEVANRQSLAQAVRAGATFEPAATGRPLTTPGLPAMATPVTGRLDLDLGAGDLLSLLTDASGSGTAVAVLSGRRIVVGRGATVSYMLGLWREPMAEDVLAILYAPGERSLSGLHQLQPGAVILGGRSPNALDLAAISGETGARVVAADDSRDLLLAPRRGGIALSYRPR